MINIVGLVCVILISVARDLTGTVAAISADPALIMRVTDKESAFAAAIIVSTVEMITIVVRMVTVTRFVVTENVSYRAIWIAERPTLRITA
jgi:hypothetical protein